MSRKNKKAEEVNEVDYVIVRGARQNNLKGVDLNLPLYQLNVITGPSGSGKSSLAFDTIYAEGQRRYVETFSPYTRQFLERMDKPAADEIRGIPPAIAIEQANHIKSSRSTVGTMTEINDYLKLLYPRVAHGFCPSCEREVRPDTPTSVVGQILKAYKEKRILVVFPVRGGENVEVEEFYGFLQAQGYLRVWTGDKVERTDEASSLERVPATVMVVQDRLEIKTGVKSRLTEAVEQSLVLGKGRMEVVDLDNGARHPYSTGWHCAHCDVDLRMPVPSLFSFNNPLGACPECRGFGRVIGIDVDRALPNKRISIRGGVVKPFQSGASQECQKHLMKAAMHKGIDVDIAFDHLPEEDQRWVFEGDKDVDVADEELWDGGDWYGVQGFFKWLESKAYKMHVRVLLSRYRSYTKCAACDGGRYQPQTACYRILDKEKNWYQLAELNHLPVSRALEVIRGLVVENEDSTVRMLQNEVATRLGYLVEVGLGYLSLDRTTRTLSGGEIERVNLTSCLGASLVNSLFVLDEPSVGLHPRDISRMVQVMKDLRDKGNTLLVVEHEEAVIRAADNLIDIGPGRGAQGGNLVYEGPVKKIGSAKNSLTAAYLTGERKIPVPQKRRKGKNFIEISGASEHNLQALDVKFPLGVFCCVTGVSGSGKSTLVNDVLAANLLRRYGVNLDEEPGKCQSIDGIEHLDEVVVVDQSPLSRTPRSTPAVYIGVFDGIRDLFSKLPESQARGYTAGTFSFNSGQGRCERCGGTGYERIEMQFLSDLYIRCPECDGKRYQPEVLEVKLEEKSVHDILSMTVTEAVKFFKKLTGHKGILEPLQVLEEVGLGYLQLGQPVNTLSGGESQRLKLVGHLVEKKAGNALLIFDEPTTGLHFDDIAMLIKVFERLVEQGNSLVVIEHNVDVIKCADHVIDLGPEAGDGGGYIVIEGTPEKVATCKKSWTGQYLRPALEGRIVEEETDADAGERAGRVARSTGIMVHGAREHNLKNISVEIPRDKMVIVTGLSGSGKSTLAFDIIFSEGQRRFLDSMSPYARQFVEQLEKPDVDLISGLPPTVAIEQRVTRGGGKSTVATVTEIYHFLRLLYAKVGEQYCPDCEVSVEKQSVGTIAEQVEAMAKKGRVRILAPLVKARKGFHTDVAKWAEKKGYELLLVDGNFVPVEGFQKLDRYREHTIDVVVGEGSPSHLNEIQGAVKRALEIGKGTAKVLDKNGKIHILSREMSCPSCGLAFEELDPRMFSFNSPHGWCATCRGFGEVLNFRPSSVDRAESVLEEELEEEKAMENSDEGERQACPQCEGARINRTARNVFVDGVGIDQFARASIQHAEELLGALKLTGTKRTIGKSILPEIGQRLEFMKKVGLSYLALGRSAKTLSGGESQRIRLAAQLGSNLRGVLYVLDEPTIGLHPRDNVALLDTLEILKGKGNSLIVVEHDEETMRRADRIIDLGPGAGQHGGTIVSEGTVAQIKKTKQSLTGQYLQRSGYFKIHAERRSCGEDIQWLQLRGARANNLKEVDVDIPLGRLVVLSGVSGSGKSSLMRGVLLPALKSGVRRVGRRAKNQYVLQPYDSIEGAEHVEAVYEVDQSPIGKTSRSTPATYIKVFDEIRKVFAQLPESRMRGYQAGRFSFNNDGGRCETCAGQGVIKMEMSFLPASYIPCDECEGKRYNAQTLEIRYQDKSIGDVMDMTIAEAAEFFASFPKIQRPLGLLVETGLGYLRLGQPSPTLSGGEAQRLKLVSQLKRGTGRAAEALLRQGRPTKSTVYLLEEPTIGLHMADVEQLLKVLHRLVEEGNSVLVIEHNVSVIAEADHLIDIGPEAGDGGGEVVASGTPEEVAKSKKSRIAPFLKDLFDGKHLC